ncbi:sulfatase [Reichenbachiella sp.]|uniref:sulfatase family protein n=1 Tax=Reichenbachiella sp. TaxID=2184521 RepID=UPI0032989182
MKIHLALLVLIGITACKKKEHAEDVSAKGPNIVFVFADDLGYGDLGCFGASDIKTPNIDRLAQEGIKFTDFYSASSVCTPSRAALLTGRMPQRFGLNGVLFPESLTGMPTSEFTIPEMLKTKGYVTGMVGKWHLGHHFQYLPLQQGFDFYFGIPYSNDMASVAYLRGNEVVNHFPDQSLMTKKFTEEAVAFIEQQKNSPFYLYLAHPMPHVPIYASDKFLGTSERGLYGDVIQELDWSVGEIINKLEELELLKNTLIVFSSDNGPWLTMKHLGGSPGELRNGKMYTFEGGMRVPTVAMWKGNIPEGTVYQEVVSQVDWFPTFAALAEAELPIDLILDGEDITSVLLGEQQQKERGFLFFDYERLEGYRKGDWKVKLPFEGWEGAWYKSPEPAHDTLLFNLKKDPGEHHNVYAENKELAIQLIEQMNLQYGAMGSLPESIVVRTEADKKHFKQLMERKNE